MIKQNLSHSQSIAEAYRARKRALELQVARFGPHCPAHIQADLEQTSAQLDEVERFLSGSDSVSTLSTHSPVTEEVSLSQIVRIVRFGFVLLVVVVLSSSLTFCLSASFLKRPELRDTSPEFERGDFVAYHQPLLNDAPPDYETLSIVCVSEAFIIEGVPGLLRVRSLRLDRISLREMPIGSRLELECVDRRLGHMVLVIIRHPLDVRGKEEVVWLVEMYRCIR